MAPPTDLAAAYDRYAARLYALARRLVSSQADAEECVQEVFVSLAERRGARIADLQAYLFTALRHAAGRRHRPLRLVLTEEPASAAIDQGEARALQRALGALPFEQREVIALKVDGELTFAEIGALLGISLNTAASRYRYAIEKLKDLLEEKP